MCFLTTKQKQVKYLYRQLYECEINFTLHLKTHTSIFIQTSIKNKLN